MIALLGAATVGSVPVVATLASASTTTTLSADRSHLVAEHAAGQLVEQAAHPTRPVAHPALAKSHKPAKPAKKSAKKSEKKSEKKAAPKATSKSSPKSSAKSSPATSKVSPTPSHKVEAVHTSTPPQTSVPLPPVSVVVGPTPTPTAPLIISSPPASTNTPTSSPTPTPSSSPAPAGIDCVSHPSACGYPDATNTGAKGALTPSGSITKTTDGQVIANLAIHGHITITSANVTIENVSIVGDSSLAAIDTHMAKGPVIIDHVTITYPAGVFPVSAGAIWSGGVLTVTNSNISGSPDGIDATGSAVLIRDNYIHDLQYNAGTVSHDDTIQTLGGNITVQHNTLDATAPASNSCLQIGNLGGNLTQLTFNNNLCNGGGYSINANSASVLAGTVTAGTMSFAGNRFGTGYKWGIKAHLSSPFVVNWSGNVSDADGSIIP